LQEQQVTDGISTVNNYPDCKDSDSLESGRQFQDFVCEQLAKDNIVLQNLSSKKYQYELGENLQGFEIKLDRLCTKTKRLSIEIAEKTKASNSAWVRSGIYRDDNTWLYIQGNYQILFIFFKNFLKGLHICSRYELDEIPTLKKFYLPFEDAHKYAGKVLEF